MANIEKQAVQALAEEMVRAIRQLTEQNNQSYVNNQIATYKVGSGNISADLYARMADIAYAQVHTATIDVAQIEELYGTVADYVYLASERAEIGDVNAQHIKAAVADMGLTNINSANIGFGQIKDLVTETAIIREGIGGKLFIDRLSATEANLVSLTTGELMLKNTSGQFVRLVVDDDGEISTEVVEFDGDDIINDNSLDADKIVKNSITARELNVSSIFADQALINSIKAVNIDTTDLFASNAFVQALQTTLISSPTFGDSLDISGNSSITLTNNKLALVVDSSTTQTGLVLTDGAIEAIGDKFDIIADDIDLSANQSITTKVHQEVISEIGYRMEIIASNGDALTPEIQTTTVSVKVFQGQTDITNTIDAEHFVWHRTSANAAADAVWDSAHVGVKSFVLTPSDVDASATYQCDLEVE